MRVMLVTGAAMLAVAVAAVASQPPPVQGHDQVAVQALSLAPEVPSVTQDKQVVVVQLGDVINVETGTLVRSERPQRQRPSTLVNLITNAHTNKATTAFHMRGWGFL